jgi:uncharacterized membrane protein
MKKIFLPILVIFFSMIILTGCTNKSLEKASSNKPVNLREITGEIVASTLDNDGNIIIDKEKITEEVTYISYEYEGVTIGLLAVKDSNDDIKVVINTCQSCGGSPYAYFVQAGDKIECQNCGNMFSITDLDNLSDSGCNPIAIEDKKESNEIITIGVKQLQNLKAKFENWQGPKI